MSALTFQRTEVFFEAICEGSPDVILIMDESGNIVFANRRSADMLGYEPSELIGRPVEVLVPKRYADHSQMRREYQRSPEARAMGKRPLLLALHKNGVEIPVDIALSPLPFEAGSGRLVVAVMRNALPRWISEREMHLRSIALDAAANGIIITNREGIIQWANPAITRMTGYSMSELVGSHTRMLKSGAHQADFYRELWETVLAGRTWYGEIVNRRKDGSIYYEEQYIAPVRGEEGEITNFIAVKQDVTARRLAENALQEANQELKHQLGEIESLRQKLQEQAIRDPLTGLFNRRYMDETLSREVARARRETTALSVVLIDVDHFKLVNDTEGHAAGDSILRGLGQILQDSTRAGDVACRFGGDEFLVLLPGANLQNAMDRAEQWRRAFAETQKDRNGGRPRQECSLSLGVAELTRLDDSQESMMRRSDEALYLAKRRGRNCVVSLP